MNLKKRNSIAVALSVVVFIAAIAGIVVGEYFPLISQSGTAIDLRSEVIQLSELLKQIASGSYDQTIVPPLFTSMFTVFAYLVGDLLGLAFIVVGIVSLATLKKNGNAKKLVANTMVLSFVPAFMFGMVMLARFANGVTSLEIGAYIALGVSGLGLLLAIIGFMLVSEAPVVTKVVRACLMVVSLGTAVLVLMPTLVINDVTYAPLVAFKEALIEAELQMGADVYPFLIMSALLILASILALVVAKAAIRAKHNKNGEEIISKNAPLAIVFSVLVALFVAGTFFGLPLLAGGIAIKMNLYSYLAVGGAALMLVLAIVCAFLPKHKVVKEAVAEEVREEVKPEPVEEKKEEPVKEEVKEEAKPEPVVAEPVKEEPVAAEPVKEEKVEEPVKEEVKEEPKEEKKPEPVKKPAPKKAPAKKEEAKPEVKEEAKPEPKAEEKKEEPAKKPAAKKTPAKKEEAKEEPKAAPKKAPTKKEEPKEEPKEEAEDAPKKNTASYHISKRAKDNKWQVFRAGSDKVIKLFDTKVEAEEYTKRMAENQGVGYLSHASKGKNKGRIQKK